MSEKLMDDLAKSGLNIEDVAARMLDSTERTALNVPNTVPGYILPYFNILGKPIPYYRGRLFDHDPKYKQIKNTAAHIYFPQTFMTVFQAANRKFILFCEGEKKAALCCKLGIPAIAFGGVDGWSNRTIYIPKDSDIGTSTHNKNLYQVKLPTADYSEALMSVMAIGFQELLDYLLKCKTQIIICYDTDEEGGVKGPVQRAAAKLGHELRYKGFSMNQIRQLILPNLGEKTSIDDYIMHKDGGLVKFLGLIEQTLEKRAAFPRHPNIREHISKALTRNKLDRKMVASAL